MSEPTVEIRWCVEHQSSHNYARSILCDQKLRGLWFPEGEMPVELAGDCRVVAAKLVIEPEDRR
jgi:hypothetical protein